MVQRRNQTEGIRVTLTRVFFALKNNFTVTNKYGFLGSETLAPLTYNLKDTKCPN